MKNRTTAALLALLLGDLGIHKFYLGQTGAGIIYLIFSCTLVPGFIAFIEFIILLTMSEESFNNKFNRSYSPMQYVQPMQYLPAPSPQAESSQAKARTLGELKHLYDAGVITAGEYEEKRRKILDSI